MTTIPKRRQRLTDNLPFLLNQTYPFDKLVINIDDNLSDDDYKWYESIKELDPRIEIDKAEAKWRSCNKLLPTLKKYPNDIIITVDDDVAYPKDCIMQLVIEHVKHPDCIIAHEINPIMVNDGYVTYFNSYDVKLKQIEWGKYLSNCALFPPHTFDNTDLYDYEKMMKCTQGTHDELWFWVQSTINVVQCIGLNYVRSFASEIIEEYGDGEYRLSIVNNSNEKIDEYMKEINDMYGEKLIKAIESKSVLFKITQDNIYSFLFLLPYIKARYKKYKLDISELTKDWSSKIINAINGKEATI